jgi:hypothetical protein
MDKRWLAFVWLWLATACGPGELPAFANPPPDDSGVRSDAGDTDPDADVNEEDAGATDAGTR